MFILRFIVCVVIVCIVRIVILRVVIVRVVNLSLFLVPRTYLARRGPRSVTFPLLIFSVSSVE